MRATLEILLVDDEPSILAGVDETLRHAGYKVVVATNGPAAIEAIDRQSFDLVLCDVRLPGVDGLSVLRHVKDRAPHIDVILMSAYAAIPDAVAALKAGAIDYLTKPFDIDELLLRIDRVRRERALQQEVEDARAFKDDGRGGPPLIGRSPVMLALFRRIEKFGQSDAPVLITGQSGTGKELVAAALHRHSPRSAQPFIAVNCAAFPETLLEAELFGHERGAFTGAVRRREGRFKAADGGTLLLDEVAEIPLPAQAKLLRVLQERSFEPLGTNESIRVDVRVLSATHRNLREQVSRGLFRADLYYRLKILELDVPALKERPGDLPLLTQYFLKRFSPPNQVLGITARAMAALTDYAFPGNVRELEHAIRHGVAMTGGLEDVDLVHLPADIAGPSVSPPTPPNGIRTLPEAMREFERDYLNRALRAAGGSRTQTAAALGISRKNLWEKLKRYGLSSPLEDEETSGTHATIPLAPSDERRPKAG